MKVGHAARWLVAVLVGLALMATACSTSTSSSREPLADVLPSPLVIASGNPGGIYSTYGAHLGAVVQSRLDVPVDVRETGGSVENLQQLVDGEAHLGFSSADSVQELVVRGDQDGMQVRAVARLYDDFLHLVVPVDSPILELEDLQGRTVSVGAPGSGTALIAGRTLELMGMDDSVEEAEFGIDDAVRGLREGEIDAFFWSGGLRTPGLLDLAEERPFRLVPLGDAAEALRAEYGSGYRRGVIPRDAYGLTVDVPTLAVPNMLVARSDLPDEAVRDILGALFEEQTTLATQVPAAAQLDRSQAIFTDPIPLHPGAIEYYRATKD